MNNDGFALEDHQRSGSKLKAVVHDLTELKYRLREKYPQSSDKTCKQIETVIDKLQSIQTGLHLRLMDEFRESDEGKLLPIYLGRHET